jgi:hypothetical protein
LQSFQCLRWRTEREVSQVVRVIVGEDVLPAERGVDAGSKRLGERYQSLPRTPCPAAGDHDGPARGTEPADDCPHLLRLRASHWRGLDRGFGIRGDLCTQHVGWQGQHYGSRTA